MFTRHLVKNNLYVEYLWFLGKANSFHVILGKVSTSNELTHIYKCEQKANITIHNTECDIFSIKRLMKIKIDVLQ